VNFSLNEIRIESERASVLASLPACLPTSSSSFLLFRLTHSYSFLLGVGRGGWCALFYY
jgi:hypothetical protein